MGRELKSVGRTLQKLGLGRFNNNNVLHMHIPPPRETVSGTKRRRSTTSTGTPSHVPLDMGATNVCGEGIIEIVDDSDDDVSKRMR